MKRGILLLILATLLRGGNYICGRFLASALPATLLNTVRWAISTIILFGLLSINKKTSPLFLQNGRNSWYWAFSVCLHFQR